MPLQRSLKRVAGVDLGRRVLEPPVTQRQHQQPQRLQASRRFNVPARYHYRRRGTHLVVGNLIGRTAPVSGQRPRQLILQAIGNPVRHVAGPFLLREQSRPPRRRLPHPLVREHHVHRQRSDDGLFQFLFMVRQRFQCLETDPRDFVPRQSGQGRLVLRTELPAQRPGDPCPHRRGRPSGAQPPPSAAARRRTTRSAPPPPARDPLRPSSRRPPRPGTAAPRASGPAVPTAPATRRPTADAPATPYRGPFSVPDAVAPASCRRRCIRCGRRPRASCGRPC